MREEFGYPEQLLANARYLGQEFGNVLGFTVCTKIGWYAPNSETLPFATAPKAVQLSGSPAELAGTLIKPIDQSRERGRGAEGEVFDNLRAGRGSERQSGISPGLTLIQPWLDSTKPPA
jgi:hypothetical protein